MKAVYLYVDDLRKMTQVSEYPVCTCRSYNASVNTILFFVENNTPIYIDLDHDLGEEKSGYDICKMIVENNIPLAGFHIHAMNPVGSTNMRQLLTHYGYKEF